MRTNLVKVDKLTNTELDFIESEFTAEDDSLVLVIETGNGNKAHFIYRVSQDVAFRCTLLCEAGRRFQRAYLDLLNEYKLKLQTVDTKDDYFEIVVPAN